MLTKLSIAKTRAQLFSLLLFVTASFPVVASPLPSTVVTWGLTWNNNTFLTPDIPGVPRPDPLLDVVSVCVGDLTALTIRANGTMGCWGDCSAVSQDLAQITNVAAVSIGKSDTVLTLQSNGLVSAWGHGVYGTTLVPAGLTGVIAVASGYYQSIALKGDGTMVTWGLGGTNVPPSLTNIIAISAARDEGLYYVLALRANGTVVSWDYWQHSMTEVSSVSNAIAISAGAKENLALKNDGTVMSWEPQNLQDYGVTPPQGLSNVVAISAGFSYNLAVKSDGQVVAWQTEIQAAASLPDGLSNVVAIAAGRNFSVALTGPLPPSITEQPQDSAVRQGDALRLQVRYIGSYPFTYQWQRDGTNLPGQASDLLTISSLPMSGTGQYRVIVSNAYGSRTSQPATVTVTPWSQIAANPQSQTVNAGTSVTFNVSVQGTAPFTFQWQRNGGDMAGATNSSLTLASVVPADSADYRVAVSNAAGVKYSSSAHLLVISTGGPNITVHPAPDTMFPGARFAFTVVATGSSSLGYQWRKDGLDVPGATSAILEFAAVQASDAGTYAVVVSDSTGATLSADAKLKVIPHAFAFPPPAAVVCLGGPAPPLDLTNAVAIAAAPNHLLALRSDGTVLEWGDSAPLPLGGSYVPSGLSNVVAIAAGNLGSSLALLRDGTVVGWAWNGPTAPLNLFGVIAISAGDQGMALKADGRVVTWGGASPPEGLQNVTAVSAGYKFALALKSDGTAAVWGGLSLFNLTAFGNATGLVAISASPGKQHGMALRSNGGLLDYSQFGLGSPNTELSGYSDAIAIAAGNSHSLVLKSNGVVVAWGASAPIPPTLSHVTAIAAGNNMSLALTAWPVILTDPQSLVVDERATSSFTVVAAGGPLSFQWQKDGVNLTDGTNATLTIANTLSGNAGQYTVVVSTPAGSITSSPAALNVNTAPAISTQPQPQTVFPGAKVAFSVTASGALPLAYQWQRNGAALPGEVGQTLTINSVQLSDAGDYTVVITNSYGSVTSAIAVLEVKAYDFILPTGGSVVSFGGAMVPFDLTNAVAIAAGTFHSVALRSDGTVVEWGVSPPDPGGASRVPPGLNHVVAVAAGADQSLALLDNGTVVGWGFGPPVPANLFGVIAIAAGRSIGMALKVDGTITTWGGVGGTPQGIAPEPADLDDIQAIAIGYDYFVALKAAGTAEIWGRTLNVSPGTLAGETDLAAVAAGRHHVMGLRRDGTVFDAGSASSAPPGLSDVVAVAAGSVQSLALLRNGTLVGWNGTVIPVGISNVTAIAAGDAHELCITVTPPAPMLEASLSQTNINIGTPVSVPGYILETTDDLSHPFEPVGADASILTFGGTNAMRKAFPGPGFQRFFRLKKVQLQ